jgi:hypothetical protein
MSPKSSTIFSQLFRGRASSKAVRPREKRESSFLLFWIPAFAEMNGCELPVWIPADAGMKGAYPFNAFSCATVAARSVLWSLPATMKR